MTGHRTLLGLPPELLSYLFLHLSTASFVQTVLTCKQLFDLASHSRDAVLAHLFELPGIKLGLDSSTISTPDLFLLLRQRASTNLYGAEIHSDYTDVRLRSGTLNPSASCLRDHADYFNISLALKESLSIRHCGFSGTLLKEHIPSPYADGTGRIVQIVQGRHTVSVLYEWEPDEVDDNIACPRSPLLRPTDPFRKDVGPTASEESTANTTRTRDRLQYHLVHYNAYNADRPEFFTVPPPPLGHVDLKARVVPVHLSVHHRRKCAIVWNVLSQSCRVQNDYSSTAVFYESDRLPTADEVGLYTATTVFPLFQSSSAHDLNQEASRTLKENEDYFSSFTVRAVEFAQNGSAIKLYHAGSVTPYAILPNRHHREVMLDVGPRSGPGWHESNRPKIQDHGFRTDTPFFAHHQQDVATPSNDDGHDSDGPRQCKMTFLALAWLAPEGDNTAIQTLDRYNWEDMLFISQSHERIDFDDCDHESPSLASISTTPRSERIVARLRGLSEHWVPTNMTALDSISVSKNGTRMAIASWNKVLVYVLDPLILAEDWTAIQVEASEASGDDGDDGDDSDSQSASTQSGSEASSHGNESDSSSTYASPGLINRTSPQSSSATLPVPEPSEPEDMRDVLEINGNAMVKAAKYYKLTRDPDFGEIVELWPVVLELPGNAVARKMMWGKAASETFFETPFEEDDESDCDSTVNDATEDEDGAGNIADADTDANADASILEKAKIEQAEGSEPTRPASSSSQFENDTTTTISVLPQPPYHSPYLSAADSTSVPAPEYSGAEESKANDGPLAEASKQHGGHHSLEHSDSDNDKSTGGKEQRKKGKGKQVPRRKKRRSEDELVVMTDRGLQLWNLGPRAKGKRTTRWLWDA